LEDYYVPHLDLDFVSMVPVCSGKVDGGLYKK